MFEPIRDVARRPVHRLRGKHRIRPALGTALMLAAMIVVSLAYATPSTWASAPPAQPATPIVVNSLGDEADAYPGDGICQTASGSGCTLRAAIQEAESASSPGLDVIDLTGLSGTISLTNGALPDIREDLNVLGPLLITLTIDGLHAARPLLIQRNATVLVANLTVANGSSTRFGGAISNSGTLTLQNATIVGSNAHVTGGAIFNSSGASLWLKDSLIGGDTSSDANSALFGGGLYNGRGAVIIEDSQISHNEAAALGGGIYNSGGKVTTLGTTRIESNHAIGSGGGIFNGIGGSLEVSNTSIDRNSAGGSGGGIYNLGAQTLVNATVGENTAVHYGGGIANTHGAVTNLYNVTIAGNGANVISDHGDFRGSGGGGIFSSAAVGLQNSLISGNYDNSTVTSYPDCYASESASFPVNAQNLIGNNAGCAAYFTNGVNGNLVGTATAPLDPMLGAFSDPGVYPLQAGSPAVDAGDPSGCDDSHGGVLTDDQRGVLRPQGPTCDIGAYEAARPVMNDQSFELPENSLNGTLVGTVVATDPDLGVLTYAITGGNTDDAYSLDQSNGNLTVNNSSALNYETTPQFNLSVVVTDAEGFTDSSTVTVDLINVNEPPIAVDDVYTATQALPLTVPAPGVLENDIDPDLANVLTAAQLTSPAYGDVRLAIDGGFVYTPTIGFAGEDAFTYFASDGVFTSTATVSITATYDPLIVRNTADSGAGSLREAINYATQLGLPATITFDIPGPGAHTIYPVIPLPDLAPYVTIDATTQPSGTVELNGSLSPAGTTGLFVFGGEQASAPSSTGELSALSVAAIRGLVIKGFPGDGIRIADAYDILVEANTVISNTGNGISVSSGTGIAIHGNSIAENGRLGIDLNDDGVTPNDIGDPDSGPNTLQNTPVLLRAVPINSGITFEGRLNSLPMTRTYTLEFFRSSTCDPSQYGEGQVFLGAHDVETNGAGNARFSTILPVVVPTGQFVTATATDPDGNTSEFSPCIVTGAGNDTWPRALRLEPTLEGPILTASASQYLDLLDQSRWYKIHIEPGTKVKVTLEDLPANYDLTLYKDIRETYDALTIPSDNSDLTKLNAEFAPDSWSPDSWSPDSWSPDSWSPTPGAQLLGA